MANRAARAGVHVILDHFEGMWHTFPQWSEGGCAGDHGELWQGVATFQRMATFVEQVSAAAIECPKEYRGAADIATAKALVHTLHTGGPGTVGPVRLSLCPGSVGRSSQVHLLIYGALVLLAGLTWCFATHLDKCLPAVLKGSSVPNREGLEKPGDASSSRLLAQTAPRLRTSAPEPSGVK